MEGEDWKAVGQGAAAIVVLGLVVGGVVAVAESINNQDMGTASGVSWQVEQPFLTHDLRAKVEGDGHRITDVHIVNPKTGDVIARPKHGETRFTVPYFWDSQDFEILACVDGRWQMSPDARTASTDSAKTNSLTITNYTGPRLDPGPMAEHDGLEICR